MVKNKKDTGKFTGLNKMLDEAVEAGLIDDIGDTTQRIKRLARQIYKEGPLYLSSGLQEARATAQLFIYSGE